jgi:hypothetical protein
MEEGRLAEASHALAAYVQPSQQVYTTTFIVPNSDDFEI